MSDRCQSQFIGTAGRCLTCGMQWEGSKPLCPAQRSRPGDPNPRMSISPSPLDMLEKAAAIFCERNEAYGENYKHFGHSMVGMFPEGLTLRTVEEWNRIGLIIACVGKLNRYGANFSEGGHADSAQDLAVYAAILRSMTS